MMSTRELIAHRMLNSDPAQKAYAELMDQLAEARGDEEAQHAWAETKLMEWLDIVYPSVSKAWKKAQKKQNWWYA